MAKTVTKETVTSKTSTEETITSEELQVFVECRNSNLENLAQLGNTEFRILTLEEEKWEIKSKIKETEEKYSNHINTIKEKYGEINVDLETGKITEINK
jgi:hypothetical protein|tara:strand:- start:14491 stop:14787 length:297 start_codon:yes stop_codon:yes gene_type:complete